jgi:uncharacterized protein HemX
MSNPSDETKPNPATPARSRRRRLIPVVVLLVAVIGIAGALLWQKFVGFGAPTQAASTETESAAAAVVTETSPASDNPVQLLKDIQTAQQQTADKLEDLQRQLAAEQGERKLLSEQVAALSGRVNALSASNASATTGMVLQAAKKKPTPPAAAAPRPAGASRQAGPQ